MLPRRPLNYSTFHLLYVAKLRPLYTFKICHCPQNPQKSFSQPKSQLKPLYLIHSTGPFPGCPCPMHCPRGQWRPGPRIMRVHPCPLRYPGPHWTLGLPRPTSPLPGVPTKRYSPFVATLPAHQQGSCTPANGFRAYIPTNSKTTSIFQFHSPANSLYTDPGVPWAGITPPPNHSSHHAFHIRSTHTDPLASLTHHVLITLSTLLNSHH